MSRTFPLLFLFASGSLIAQESPRPWFRPAVRLQGGMLNPDDPLRVTMAFGAAAGVRLGHFGIFLRGLRQSQNGNAGSDLTSDARTFWGAAFEYEGSTAGVHERQGLVQLGAGRLDRPRFRTSWFVQAGLALRYRVARSLALVGSVEDHAAFLPYEEARCESAPGGGEICTDAVKKQVQHNFGFMIAFEFHP